MTDTPTPPALADLPTDGDGYPTLEGSGWSRIIVGNDGTAVCGWDDAGTFHAFATTEAIADRVFSGLRDTRVGA